jgi:hypothetical protein
MSSAESEHYGHTPPMHKSRIGIPGYRSEHISEFCSRFRESSVLSRIICRRVSQRSDRSAQSGRDLGQRLSPPDNADPVPTYRGQLSRAEVAKIWDVIERGDITDIVHLRPSVIVLENTETHCISIVGRIEQRAHDIASYLFYLLS